jgi:hypothetical protein
LKLLPFLLYGRNWWEISEIQKKIPKHPAARDGLLHQASRQSSRKTEMETHAMRSIVDPTSTMVDIDQTGMRSFPQQNFILPGVNILPERYPPVAVSVEGMGLSIGRYNWGLRGARSLEFSVASSSPNSFFFTFSHARINHASCAEMKRYAAFVFETCLWVSSLRKMS